jgi:deoxyribose-phosphate aldolase
MVRKNPTMTKEQFAKYFDMTNLKPAATRDDILRLCDEAARIQPASICIYPIWVKTAVKALAGSGVKVCTVAGFPTGCSIRPVKAQEIKSAVAAGAAEVDMVLNIGALKTGDWGAVEKELRDLIETARVAGLEAGIGHVVTKVIIECCFLTDEEKTQAATLVHDLAADFVKTSTGFGTGGATVEDVRLLRETVGPEMGVKAAGGIRTTADALAMIEAGATRIGASSTAEILAGYEG